MSPTKLQHRGVSPMSDEEARDIAIEAYIYGYPAVIMALTRRSYMARPGNAINSFTHRRALQDASFTAVVRPNADTLYSVMWFDLTAGPLAIRVPDSTGRYYLLQMLDHWSDTFAVPGSRTTGNGEQAIVLAPPNWQGKVAHGAILVHSPTMQGWIIGRTQTNGTADHPGVHEFQAGLSAAPWNQTQQDFNPPVPSFDHTWEPDTPPVELIEKLNAQLYFGLLASIATHNPPHTNDYPIVHRMARLGLKLGEPFALDALPAQSKQALRQAASTAIERIKRTSQSMGMHKNNWQANLSAIGTYGTDYCARAAIACVALGANPVEDAVYWLALQDSEGRPLSSEKRYSLHFEPDRMPPVRAFWSLSMYNQRLLFAANSADRYTIGSRDALRFAADGSLDVLLQREVPTEDRQTNWLPTPADGPFSLALRLYWPRPDALAGRWFPPLLRMVA